MADSCGTCFFGRIAAADAGQTAGLLICARNAPATTLQSGAPVTCTWPVVQTDFWCGQFARSDPAIYGTIAATAVTFDPGKVSIPVNSLLAIDGNAILKGS